MIFLRSKEQCHGSSHTIIQQTGSWNPWQRKDLLRDWILYELVSWRPSISRLVHHDRDNFSNSAELIWLGVVEFLLSLMGSLCMDPC